MIVRDLDVANRRMLLPVKKNLSIDRCGFAYGIRDGLIEWDTEPIAIKGDDYLYEATFQPTNPLAREYQFERDRAAEWLYVRLSAGRVHSLVVIDDAEKNEISYSTLRRAFKSLGCKSSKEKGKGRHSEWHWRLPGEGAFYRAWAPRLVAQHAQLAGFGQLFQ